MITQAFEEAYGKLNKAQREAVDAVEGPVMVVAGPGTGKTQILALRIANILLKTDADPSNILALTFTEAGVTAMRRRLAEIVGSAAYAVEIGTFHSFCNDIIRRYPESFPAIVGAASITDVDQIRILERLFDSLPLSDLKTFGDPYFYLKPVLGAVNTLKREGVSPDEFERIVETQWEDFHKRDDLYHEKGPHKGKMKGACQDELKRLKKQRELVSLYRAYQAALAEERVYDYNDMIMRAVEALEADPDLLLSLQEQYQYVLVDEHQDTNRAQNKVLELLVNFHPDPNLFVVGDEKQAIFRFQGASLENFLYFKRLYPSAKLVVLEENYRSTQAILDSAHSLIPGQRPLKANAPHESRKIGLYSFSRPEAESFFVATDIRRKLDEGVRPDEIAILYRDNKDALDLVPSLEKAGVPFVVQSNRDALVDGEVAKLEILLRAVGRYGDPEACAKALHLDFLGLHPLDVYKIIRRAAADRLNVAEALSSADGPQAAELGEKLASWAVKAKNMPLVPFLELLVRESGFLAALLKHPDGGEKLAALAGLFDEAAKLAGKDRAAQLEQFLEYLDLLREHGIAVAAAGPGGLRPSVRLMTAHRSKGLEFEYVYVTQAFDGHWGNKRKAERLPLPSQVYFLSGESRDEASPNDDERRLFYVALTRAKKDAVVTFARAGLDGKERLASQFVGEIDPALVEARDTEPFERAYAEDAGFRFRPPAVSGASLEDREYLGGLFVDQGLSVTALNNYLKCPWRYFYSNLVRLPKVQAKHQMYGTAVHGALQDLFIGLKRGEVSKERFLERFEDHLKRQALPERDFAEALEKGWVSLSGYYDAYVPGCCRDTIAELNVTIETEGVKLTGKIDKLELLGGGEVNVVDYKTGSPKTRGEIEGATKSSEGDIKRQLVFYNLLLNEFDGGKFRMASGEIDFVEPDAKGKYRKEKFFVEPAEVEELRKLVAQTAAEIRELAFWGRFCGDGECEYCGLRRLTNS